MKNEKKEKPIPKKNKSMKLAKDAMIMGLGFKK